MGERYKPFPCNVRLEAHRVVFSQITPGTSGAKRPSSHSALRLIFQLNWSWLIKDSFLFLLLPTGIQTSSEELEWSLGTRSTPGASKRTLGLANSVATSCLYLPVPLQPPPSNANCSEEEEHPQFTSLSSSWGKGRCRFSAVLRLSYVFCLWWGCPNTYAFWRKLLEKRGMVAQSSGSR